MLWLLCRAWASLAASWCLHCASQHNCNQRQPGLHITGQFSSGHVYFSGEQSPCLQRKLQQAHKRVVVADYHVQEGLTGTVVSRKHCVLVARPAALHLPVDMKPSQKSELYDSRPIGKCQVRTLMYLDNLAVAPLCGVTLHVALFKHLKGPAKIFLEEEVESVAADCMLNLN